MKKIICLIVFVTLFFTSIAQVRFSKILRGGYRGATFINAFIEKDTIFASGTVIDSTWGAWFVKMDTSGNIIMQKQYKMQPNNEFFVSDNGWGLIKTKDGGYAMLGVTYFSTKGVLIKIKNNGDLDFIKYHEPPFGASTMWYNRIVETSDNYYILAELYIPGVNRIQSYLNKMDKKGNIIWSKFHDPAELHYLDMAIESDTLIRLSGGGLLNNKGTPLITYIDTSGKEIKRVWGTQDFGAAAFFLQKNNNNWVYVNIERQVSTGLQQSQHDYWINVTDENFKLLSHKKIGYTTDRSMPNNLCKLGNDEYIALLSMKPASQVPATLSYNGAFIQKFNVKGDLFWNRLDTFFWAGLQCLNEYVSALPLPSGNIMVLGWTQKCYGATIEEQGAYAWVVKLSKDGCLLEPLCGISATGENFDIQQFRAFPNPATSIINIEWKVPNESPWQLILRDYSGRIVRQEKVAAGSLNQSFQVEDLANGIYFYEIMNPKWQRLDSGKIVIQK